MLTQFYSVSNIPVTDSKRAIEFYTQKLGFKNNGGIEGVTRLESPSGSLVLLYERPQSNANHTLMSLVVKNIEETVRDLIADGIVFEKYDMPWATWQDDLPITVMQSPMGEIKSAWFKDSEGNILGLNNEVRM